MKVSDIFKAILKNESVFCISFLLAVASAFVVHPDSEYLAYPDYRTLALLFCLMLIVAGIQALGIFDILGHYLLDGAGSIKKLSAIMVLLCFFSSMVITNDVTLITFVPFTILIFKIGGRAENLLKLVVLETIAANMGSMATPIGNPQNLYLYSASGIKAAQFAKAVLPYSALSLVMLMVVVFIGRDEPVPHIVVKEKTKGAGRNSLRSVLPYLLLLLLCLLVVFRILPYLPVLICVIVVVLVVNRKLFLSVDYFLLMTFIFFFVFIGNMKRIPEISTILSSVVQGRELLMGVLTSQVISNVPTAILLSGFSENFCSLITGVNLGGLGTLIASLASLISYKFFVREYPDNKGHFLKVFTIWNLVFLFILMVEAFLIAG